MSPDLHSIPLTSPKMRGALTHTLQTLQRRAHVFTLPILFSLIWCFTLACYPDSLASGPNSIHFIQANLIHSLSPKHPMGQTGTTPSAGFSSHLGILPREFQCDEWLSPYPHLQAGVKDTENRVALHALTRPPALLFLAAASSGLRFILASFALALLLPVFLAVAAVKLGLRARWGSLPPPGGLGGPWVAVRGSGDVCGVLALAPGANLGDGARVTRLSVSRWHRRRGVGRRLLAFAETRARAWAGSMGEPRGRLVVPVAVAAWGVAGLLEACGYQAEGGWGCMGYMLVREFSKDL